MQSVGSSGWRGLYVNLPVTGQAGYLAGILVDRVD
jgi:hypothetical protein